jgi:site-specific recombinase XerD
MNLLLAERQEQASAGRRSTATVKFYKQKSGHLVRLFEHDAAGQPVEFRLHQLDARQVDDYVSVRREEGAAEATIAKELVTLRAALKLARRKGLWFGDVAAVVPIAFSAEYKPRTRFLTRDELEHRTG